MAVQVQTATKTKNRLVKANSELEKPLTLAVSLTNITVNGDKRGCSGFVENKRTGKTVYLNTEVIPLLEIDNKRYMYRTAKNTRDYVGGRNQWAESMEELVKEVLKLLSD